MQFYSGMMLKCESVWISYWTKHNPALLSVDKIHTCIIVHGHLHSVRKDAGVYLYPTDTYQRARWII